MKKWFNLLLGVLTLSFILTSCEKEEDRVIVTPGKAPVTTATGNLDYVLTIDNAHDTICSFSWSAAEYGEYISSAYTVQFDLAANDFSNPVSDAAGNNVYQKAYTSESLNNILTKLGAKAGEPCELKMRIKADPVVSGSPYQRVDPLISNLTDLSFTPYSPPKAYPDNMYMIGDEFGGWDWNSSGVAVMTPVWGLEGHFWCVRYISAGKGFKWNSKREWGGDFFKLDEEIGYTDRDGNAYVDKDGMYMVYMDMPNGKISVEPAKVYGMGDCFGSWDTGKYPFQVSGKTMTITTTGTGDLRMYANSNISPIGGDWWKMEFIILAGQIAYRGNGNDQERVPVTAGKTVTLDFNAGTGTIR